ncbi:spore cortex biosynthesis protein YabQ [Anaeromicropila populeti]|uniref:Spore cortex biosynthesis protein YabQ n=1 Tax=Anaeromicropila populeti TaxID=37658 RepID=A0A1I6IYH2_9FIRM|nr:spore cortex biosynthesis protein YabQ [Anaeromicropila populeti]SFR71681.1 spore cortex biosynthesis protein YabQ [Anaeromicropila populeti]
MIEEMKKEVVFFLSSLLLGIIILIVYDILRIIRRILPHAKWVCALEDIIFWIASAISMFYLMYEQNSGIIRSFSIFGMCLGMFWYHAAVSEWLVKSMTGLIKKIIRFIKKMTAIIMKPVVWLIRRAKWFGFFVIKHMKKPLRAAIKALKKVWKTVKIAVTKK